MPRTPCQHLSLRTVILSSHVPIRQAPAKDFVLDLAADAAADEGEGEAEAIQAIRVGGTDGMDMPRCLPHY